MGSNLNDIISVPFEKSTPCICGHGTNRLSGWHDDPAGWTCRFCKGFVHLDEIVPPGSVEQFRKAQGKPAWPRPQSHNHTDIGEIYNSEGVLVMSNEDAGQRGLDQITGFEEDPESVVAIRCSPEQLELMRRSYKVIKQGSFYDRFCGIRIYADENVDSFNLHGMTADQEDAYLAARFPKSI